MILFFLPHAGGSAKSYCTFRRYLPKELKVIPMELSGRLMRSSEPMLTDIQSCAADLINVHREALSSEGYALFGHSLGTLLCTELVRQLSAEGIHQPEHVFLSGRCAPDLELHCIEDAETATDEEIVKYFLGSSLMQPMAIPDPQLKEILERNLCTDVRMAERYSVTPEEARFPCDLTVMYGTEDRILQGADMAQWERFTAGRCEVIPFTGDHFYYNAHKQEVCEIIADRLNI